LFAFKIKKQMKKIFFTTLIALVSLFESQAQQDPHYTQYMYNMNVINPAYAGSKENLSFGLLYRKQWVNIEGAPATFTAFGHSPVGKNVGLGLSAISDKVGPVNEKNVYADFSYTLNFGNERKLALGLKAGATFHDIGLLSEVNPSLQNQFDPAFLENVNKVNPNVGAGLFYYSNKFYVSLSVPNIFKSKHFDKYENGDGIKYGTETTHYFLTSGYVFQIATNTKFKPSLMLKSAFNAPPSLDVSANFLFFEKFEAGVTYRLKDSFGAMINYKITDGLRVGYAYDHIVSRLNVVTPSSHEVILLFDLNFPKKISSSPRYF
jgi:type IX secretion system PorP/SprF family membrane protein